VVEEAQTISNSNILDDEMKGKTEGCKQGRTEMSL
jgi:hypothetical protein